MLTDLAVKQWDRNRFFPLWGHGFLYLESLFLHLCMTASFLWGAQLKGLPGVIVLTNQSK